MKLEPGYKGLWYQPSIQDAEAVRTTTNPKLAHDTSEFQASLS